MRDYTSIVTADRARLIAEGEQMLDLAEQENRALTAAEQQRMDAITAKVAKMNADLEREAGKQRPTFREQPSNALDRTPLDELDGQRSRIAMPAHGGGKLRAFQNTPRGREDAYASGMWLKAVLLQDAAANRWCQGRGLTCDVQAAAATSPNTAGGALTPDILSNRIIDLREEYGLFRQRADVVPMGGGTETFARRVGGLTANFVGEGVAIDESDVTWDNVTLTAKKAAVLTRFSSELSDDAVISVADRFVLEIALAFAELEDRCGLNGSGSAADGGITGVLVAALQAAHSMAKVVTVDAAHDTLGEIDADDLLALMGAIPNYAKNGAAWFCSPTAKALIFDAIAVAGGGTTSQMLAERMASSFLGYPIYTTPLMADSASTDYSGAVMVAFGNLRQAAMLGSRREIRVALSADRYFELDQVAVRGTERFDINAHDLGSTTVKSPFCVLVGGAS